MSDLKIITIANRKGGAGKSTCAAHIASEAVKNNKRVLIVDLDPQKTLEAWWEKREDDNPFLADVNTNNLQEKIEIAKEKNFDLCIVDTPGDTSLNATLGIKIADLVIIPSKPTAPDLRAIGRTISMVEENNKNYVFIITQATPQSNKAVQASSILSEFGAIAPSIIGHRVSYANAMSDGTFAGLVDKNANEEVEKIWKYIETKLYDMRVRRNGKEKI